MGDELPRSLELLWRPQDRRRRGPAQALTLDRIVTAAIEIADEDGLPALSMARLAERLGSAPMSLYRHVANKDELQVFMMNAAPGEPPAIADGPWRTALEQWARALRDVYLRHPWILQVTLGRPPLEPNQLAWLDRGLGTLKATSLSHGQRMSVVMLVLNFVRGDTGIAVLLQGGGDPQEMETWYWQTLATLVEADRFPALAELIAHADGQDPPDFDFGLARILDGVGTLIQS